MIKYLSEVVEMKQRELNFIRATARGIARAMDDLKIDERESLINALAAMTAPKDKLTSEETGYFALMYLAAHDWEAP